MRTFYLNKYFDLNNNITEVLNDKNLNENEKNKKVSELINSVKAEVSLDTALNSSILTTTSNGTSIIEE